MGKKGKIARTENYNPNLAQALINFGKVCRQLGAEGAWIVRGASVASLHLKFHDQPEMILAIEPPHPTIMLIVFPVRDGGEPGIETG